MSTGAFLLLMQVGILKDVVATQKGLNVCTPNIELQAVRSCNTTSENTPNEQNSEHSVEFFSLKLLTILLEMKNTQECFARPVYVFGWQAANSVCLVGINNRVSSDA